MHKFVRNVITEWRRLELPFSDATFIVAVSGGADSLSLLLTLRDLRERKKLDLRFVVGHFNHNLRGAESDRDEEFVKGLASEFNFELALGHARAETDGNLEQNARNSRYQFLRATAERLKAFGVITAHTVNDQAETFLMNLLRGSGIDGLGGMKPLRHLADISQPKTTHESRNETQSDAPFLPFFSPPVLVRPLLTWAKRADTENFCREMGLEYRYDTMNEDLSFKRVRIRKILLPTLTDFNPKIVETLAGTADLLRLAAEQLHAESGSVDETLSLQQLELLHKSELFETIRGWLRQHRGNLRSLELKHIEAIERLILSQKSGRTVELPNGETVTKQGGKLVFAKIKVDK